MEKTKWITEDKQERFVCEELHEEIKLTDKEADAFVKFENAVYYDNGLKWINLGFADVKVYDIWNEDEEEGQILECVIRYGIEGETVTEFYNLFHRQTGEFKDK